MAESRTVGPPLPQAAGAIVGTGLGAGWGAGLEFHEIAQDFEGPSFGVPTRQGEIRFERAHAPTASNYAISNQRLLSSMYGALVAGSPASDFVEEAVTLVRVAVAGTRNCVSGAQNAWTIEAPEIFGGRVSRRGGTTDIPVFVDDGVSSLSGSSIAALVRGIRAGTDRDLAIPRQTAAVRDDWHSLHDQVRSFARLPHGWDGETGVGASQLTVDRAVAALETLAGAEVVCLPELAYSGDGELDFLWEIGDTVASIGFFPDETVTIYAHEPKMSQPMQFEGKVYPADRIEELALWLRSESGRPFAFRMD